MSSSYLRDAGELLSPVVKQRLAERGLTETHPEAVKLAEGYARIIDEHPEPAWAFRWIGPLLLDALESLGATPASANRQKHDDPDQAANQLAQLRAARRRRA